MSPAFSAVAVAEFEGPSEAAAVAASVSRPVGESKAAKLHHRRRVLHLATRRRLGLLMLSRLLLLRRLLLARLRQPP